MLIKLKRSDCFDQYPKFPWSIEYRNKHFFPETYNRYVLTLPSKTVKSYAKELAVALLSLMQSMGYEKLVFLGDSTVAWLHQQNDYKPVREAVAYLTGNKVSKTFNGGLIVNTDEIGEFAKHLFWLVRCNAAFPNVHAMDEGEHIIISLCKYGNIHFYTLDEATDNLLKEQLPSVELYFLNTGTCYERFGKKRHIAHRETV